jgi:hypothetical protein
MVQVPFGNTMVSRIRPAAGAEHYKTYGAVLPRKTHWVSATCQEIDCEPYLNGWSIDSTILTEQDQAVIKQAGYRYIVVDTLWVFEAGQPCFKSSQHQRENGRPPVYFERRGDWRGDPTGEGPRIHKNADDWVDSFATNLDRVNAAIEKG